MNAAIYVRYNNSSSVSTEQQLIECRKYAKEKNFNIINEYVDCTESKREQFKKMIDESNQHLFDTVIVYSTDRFSRNRCESIVYKTRLKQNNIKVVYVKDDTIPDPSSVLMDNVLEGMLEYIQSNKDIQNTIIDMIDTSNNNSIIFDKMFEEMQKYIKQRNNINLDKRL